MVRLTIRCVFTAKIQPVAALHCIDSSKLMKALCSGMHSKNPVLRDRVFTGLLVFGLAHGAYMMAIADE